MQAGRNSIPHSSRRAGPAHAESLQWRAPTNALQHLLALTAPLFLLVLVGYLLVRAAKWEHSVGDALTRFVFAVAVPTLLFRLMSGLSRMPPVDLWLVAACFGGSLLLFAWGR